MKHHSQGMADRFRRLIAYDPLAGLHHKKREAGGRVNLAAHIAEQSKAVDTNPTDGQKEAGNYRKGHVKVHGLDISIENPRGSWREGGPPGNRWKAKLPHHYGDIKRTIGGDQDNMDCFIGPHLKSPHVFVIDQHHLAGSKDFDEHKCMIGFGSKTQAREAYHRAFSDGRGKERIGHLETMTVDEFKDWLKNSDTTAPVKHRADGGRVHMADGGVPSFDQTQPVSDGPPPFEATQPVEPDRGGLNAALQGAKAGATFNFSDELLGARAAAPKVMGHEIPDFVGPVPAKTIAGMGRLAYEHFAPPEDASTSGNAAYEKARDEERKSQEIAKSQHPYLHMAGEIAGSIPAMAALPEAGFVTRAAPTAGKLAMFGRTVADAAVTGGEYGGLSGLGEGKDTADRAVKSAEGIVGGIVGGAVAPVIPEVAGAVYNKVAKPTVSLLRGAINPEGEASRRLVTALRADQDLISQGKAEGMSPTEWVAARARGEPVTLADLGSTNTQALLRSAANTSPSGRAELEQAFSSLVGDNPSRFATQGTRTANDVRNLVAGGANANKTADQLVAEYDAGRTGYYKRAFSQPAAQSVWSPELEQMTQAPVVQNAIRMANITAKNEAAKLGFTPMKESPFAVDANGRMTLQTRPDGTTVTPNLQYWDAVKKNLDKMGADGNAWAKTLRDHLDSVVPEYGHARGFAANYFGESDALAAGRAAARKKLSPDDLAKAMRQMDPQEKDIFREGYASSWADDVIGNMSKTRDITKAMYTSDNDPKRVAAVFGPGGMDKIKARMTLETIMDGARKAMGNSTTARQLIESGLAGGAVGAVGGGYEGYQHGGIWGAFQGAGEAGAMTAVATKYVNSAIARRVAALLTSNDPAKLELGIKMASKNQKIAEGLRSIANRMALAGQTKATPRVPIDTTGWGIPRLQGPVPAGANDEQNGPKGPIH